MQGATKHFKSNKKKYSLTDAREDIFPWNCNEDENVQNLRIQALQLTKLIYFATLTSKRHLGMCKFKFFFTSKYLNSIYNVKA